ncbi:hypothetical protein QYM36_000971 [Artemia franciscana]|uniref:Ionotropic glutamate receptor C-terminal domain-containing protein n=1 Tax=Artemia franciscana TaxID=6661 RepID=A0AA88I833_ARTSF|nr:hypothetical protein QYM36_000971 [Artemia franciscana]
MSDCLPLMKLVRKYEISKTRKITVICAVANTCRFGYRKKRTFDFLKGLRHINSFLMETKPRERVAIILIDIQSIFENKKAYLESKKFPFIITKTIPFVDITTNTDGNHSIKGSLWDTKEIIEKKLKFKFQLVGMFNFTGYKEENGSYNYGLNVIHSKDAEFDFSIQGLTEEKIRDFDYVFAIGGAEAGQITFMTRYPRKGDSLKLFAVLDPFSAPAWILIVIITGVMTLFIWLIISIQKIMYVQKQNNVLKPEESLLKVGMSILGIILSRSGLPVPEISAIRVTLSAWCLTAVVIGGLYTRSFQASAVVPISVQGPLTAKNLVDQRYKYVPKTGQVQEWIESRTTGYAKLIGESVKNNDLGSVTIEESLKKVLNDKYVYFASKPSLRVLVGRDRQKKGYCRFWLGKEVMHSTVGALFLRKNSPLTEPLQDIALRLVETGVIDKLIANYTFEPYVAQCKKPLLLSKGKAIRLEDFVSAFSLFGFCVAIAMLVHGFEVGFSCQAKYAKKKELAE